MTEDGGNGATTSPVTDEEADGSQSDVAEAPDAATGGSSALGETEADTDEATPHSSDEPVPTGTPELAPANDNQPAVPCLPPVPNKSAQPRAPRASQRPKSVSSRARIPRALPAQIRDLTPPKSVHSPSKICG